MITKKEYWSLPVSKMSMTSALNQTKERCKMALKRKVAYTENDEGEYVYEDCDDEVAEKEIGKLIDNLAYQMLESMDSGRALENLLIKEIGKEKYMSKEHFQEYLVELGKEKARTDLGEYIYEPDEDEIDQIEKES